MGEHPENHDGAAGPAGTRADRMKGMIHPQTRALHRYFEELRGNRAAPLRAEVDPRDMPCRASHLFILENLGRGQLRFRLAGSALADAFGMELRGLNVRMMMEGRGRESFAALIEECLAEPGIGYARLARSDRPEELWETLLLPMRSDGGAIDRVLGSLVALAETPPARRGRAGLSFAIAEMTIRPIREGAPVAGPQPVRRAVEGFAEDGQTPFAGPPAAGPLTAIDGGRENVPEPGQRPEPGAAPHLRIVRDE